MSLDGPRVDRLDTIAERLEGTLGHGEIAMILVVTLDPPDRYHVSSVCAAADPDVGLAIGPEHLATALYQTADALLADHGLGAPPAP